MGNISVALPSDGETIESADYNTPINTIVNEINGSLDNSNLASDAAISGSKLADTSVTNAKLATGAGEPGGEWTSWTPTLDNLSGGSITYAKYKQVGKTVFFRFRYQLAGAGVSGGSTFTAPVTAHGDYALSSSAIMPVGNAMYYDANGAWFLGGCYFNNSTTVISLSAILASGTYGGVQGLSSTIPFTWASGDAISVSGSYEAA